MIKNKETIALFGTLFFLQFIMIFFIEQRFVNGMLAGYAAGLINYFVITLTVKRIIIGSSPGMNAKKMAAAGAVYIIKIMFFAALVFMLVRFREYYGIFGFLAGFTVSLAGITAAYFMFEKKKIKRS